jgi:5-methylcytosine-specific restriction endonuclease McrA
MSMGDGAMGKRIEYRIGEVLGDHGISFVSDVENKKGEHRKALLKCHCGNIFESHIIAIKNNSTKSCGCIQGKKQTIQYKEGQVIGDNSIKFIRDYEDNSKDRKAIFKCHCGKEFVTRIQHIKMNVQKNCGHGCIDKIEQYKKGQPLGKYGISFIKEVFTKVGESRRALMKCHCGNEFTTKICSIKNNHTKSCGCEQNKSKQYIAGQKVGSYGFIFIKDIDGKLGSERKALVKCHCGKEYISKISPIANNHTKSCGCSHKNIDRSNFEHACSDCGKIFYGGPRAKYCIECKTRICSVCGKEFVVKQKKLNNEWSEYCSKECAGKGYKGHPAWNKGTTNYVIVECKHCGKEMKVKDWKRKKEFCSWACWGKYHQEKGTFKRSDNPPSWRRTVFHTPEYKSWRKAVLTRDGGVCRECWDKDNIKNRKELVAHHIVPIYADKSKVFEVDNGITLCKSCHLKTLNHEAEFSDYYFNVLKLEPIKVEKQWFKEINVHQILRKYELGYTQKQVAAHFGVCVPTIQKRLVNQNLPKRWVKPKNHTFYSILSLRMKGNSIKKISELTAIDQRRITEILQLWGNNLNTAGIKGKGLTGNVLRRTKHLTNQQLANIFNVHFGTVTSYRKKRGFGSWVRARSTFPQSILTPSQQGYTFYSILKLYLNGKSTKEISKIVCTEPKKISQVLSIWGTNLPCKENSLKGKGFTGNVFRRISHLTNIQIASIFTTSRESISRFKARYKNSYGVA